MKIILLISLALASTVYVGSMASENDSCPVNQDSVQLSADSTQLFDPLQGYIFERDTTKGWIVNSCPSTSIILGYVDVCGNATKLIPKLNKPIRWNVCPSGYSSNSSNSSLFLKNGTLFLNNSDTKKNGNSDNKQTSHPENSTPWWIQD